MFFCIVNLVIVAYIMYQLGAITVVAAVFALAIKLAFLVIVILAALLLWPSVRKIRIPWRKIQ